MTQDFAKTQRASRRKKTVRKAPGSARRRNNRRKPARKTSAPLWAYGVIGLLIAVLIALLLFIVNEHYRDRSGARGPADNTVNTETIPQPRFDFYELLKQQQVEVPDRSDEIAASIPQDVVYFLQAGSFRQAADADELRAQLLLLNLEAKVEAAVNNSDTWHRVIVGPFQSRSKMAKARSILASNNLSPLLLKRRTNDPP